MAAATNGAGIVAITRPAFAEVDGSMHYAQANFLDELPGVAFALITLVYVVASLAALV